MFFSFFSFFSRKLNWPVSNFSFRKMKKKLKKKKWETPLMTLYSIFLEPAGGMVVDIGISYLTHHRPTNLHNDIFVHSTSVSSKTVQCQRKSKRGRGKKKAIEKWGKKEKEKEKTRWWQEFFFFIEIISNHRNVILVDPLRSSIPGDTASTFLIIMFMFLSLFPPCTLYMLHATCCYCLLIWKSPTVRRTCLRQAY